MTSGGREKDLELSKQLEWKMVKLELGKQLDGEMVKLELRNGDCSKENGEIGIGK